jgi:hypothetical protein
VRRHPVNNFYEKRFCNTENIYRSLAGCDSWGRLPRETEIFEPPHVGSIQAKRKKETGHLNHYSGNPDAFDTVTGNFNR